MKIIKEIVTHGNTYSIEVNDDVVDALKKNHNLDFWEEIQKVLSEEEKKLITNLNNENKSTEG